MSQVSGSQVSLCDPILYRQIKLIKTYMEGVVQWRCLWEDVCQSGTDDSGVETGEEEGHAPTEVSDLITVGLGDAFDQAMQAQTSQVIGHLAWGELIWGEAQERCEQHPQLVIGETLRQKPKSDEGAEQSMDTRIGEAQSGDPLTRNHLGLVDLMKSFFSQKAIVADVLDAQETSVGLKADLPQSRQILQPFADLEVTRIVDGSFGA